MKRFALVFGLLVSAFSHGQDKIDMFGDDKKTFVLLPAEVIASGTVKNVQFSPSGRYILYTRTANQEFETLLTNLTSETPPATPKPNWFRYDRTSKTSKAIPLPDGARQVMMLGDDKTIYFSGILPNDPQGFIDLSNGATTKTNFDFSQMIYLGDMPSAPYFMFHAGENSIQLLKPNGQSFNFKVPPKVSVFRPLDSNSSTMRFLAVQKGMPSKVGYLVYQMSDGSTAFSEISRDQWAKHMEDDDGLISFTIEQNGELDLVRLSNLSKKLVTDLPTKAKLGRAGTNARFGPNSDCVAYEDAGALLIRDIKPMDQAFARKYQAQVAKTKAINDSKQAAMALIMYAADMDDVLPGVEGWDTKVFPYSKDQDLLKNFNYTYKGGNMSGIENPATTELGFTMGPGGRAVAYADGHVKWVPNP